MAAEPPDDDETDEALKRLLAEVAKIPPKPVPDEPTAPPLPDDPQSRPPRGR